MVEIERIVITGDEILAARGTRSTPSNDAYQSLVPRHREIVDEALKCFDFAERYGEVFPEFAESAYDRIERLTDIADAELKAAIHDRSGIPSATRLDWLMQKIYTTVLNGEHPPLP